MLTKEKIYQQAFALKQNRRKEKEKQRDILLAAAYQAYPRLAEIEREQAAVGAQLAIAALSDMVRLNDLKQRSEALSAEKRCLLEKAQVKDITYDCPVCRDTGYVAGKICDCVKAIATELTFAELSGEMPLADSRFDNFDLKYYPNRPDANGRDPRRRMTGIFKTCTEYVLHFDPKQSKNLLFMGKSGLGKTHLSLAIVGGVLNKGFLPVYGSAENLFDRIAREKFSGADGGAYESMIKADLLVIDDLGAEMETSLSRSALYNLVNTRLLAGRPVIINTNLSMKEIAERYTARISSRLIGHYEAWEFLGTDIRQQKALEEQTHGV